MRGAGSVLLVWCAMAGLGCRRDVPAAVGSVPVSADAVRAEDGVPGPDVAAYRRGVTREVTLVRAAIATLRRTGDADERAVVVAGAASERTSIEGARVAGLPLDRYRQLVAVVDSLLLSRGAAAGHSGPAVPGGSVRGGAPLAGIEASLDSLRVDLVVARSRLAAESGRRCTGGAGSPC